MIILLAEGFGCTRSTFYIVLQRRGSGQWTKAGAPYSEVFDS